VLKSLDHKSMCIHLIYACIGQKLFFLFMVLLSISDKCICLAVYEYEIVCYTISTSDIN